MRSLDDVTRIGVEKFQLVGDSVDIVLRLDRRRIGVVHPDQHAVGVTHPDGHRRRRQHRPHRRDLRRKQIVARFYLRTHKALAGEITKADDRRTADGAAAYLDHAPAG